MRLFFAALFAFCVISAVGIFVLVPLQGKMPEFGIWILTFVTFLGAVFVSGALFNRPAWRISYPTVEELEAQGLVITTDFQAKRALQVEEYEDEGLHFYLELNDGSVLFLNGQYLYDYDPITDDPELNQARQFPCTNFSLKRHRIEGWAMEIVTGGTVFEPEFLVPAFVTNGVPEDGDVIRNQTFDQIKQQLLARR